jgi:hypothetical protein
MTTWNKLAIFVTGIVLGSAITWNYAKTKYAKIADEEIASVKAAFKSEKSNEDSDICEEKNDIEKMEELAIANRYVTHDKVIKKEETDMNEPYVISPDDFDENGYEIVSLTYYADDVLTDEHDNVIRNRDKLIGKDSLTKFGEYEEDSVFVRDDERKIDYEILADTRNYRDL